MQLRLLVVAALAAALPINEKQNEKRDDVVVMTTTKGVGWAQLFGQTTTAPTVAAVSVAATTPAAAVVANTPATATATTAAAATAATAASSTSNGFLSSLMNLFGGSGSSLTTTTAATTTPATTTATATKSSGGWLSNLLLGFLGGSGSSSAKTTAATSAAAVAPSVAVSASSAASSSKGLLSGLLGSKSGSASSSVEQPGFTGLVEVSGAGTSLGTGDESDLSASVALDSEVAKVAAYAENGAGITYSPYTKSGQCKLASQVALDIKMLRAYKLIRLYSVDCSGIQNVVSALSLLQKLFLGVWDIDNLDNDLPSLAKQVLTGSRGWSAVHTVSIGNELVNAGTKTVAQIKTAVSNARSWFKSNASGYSGYIVSVDTLAAVMADSSMCDISDYLAVNCHPYFSGIEALTSGTWLKAQVQSLQSHCNNGKTILITESGWPTYGNTVGQAVPSQQNQYLSVKSLANVMGSQVIMFTTFNDYWKSPGSWNVEQHWGVYGDPLA